MSYRSVSVYDKTTGLFTSRVFSGTGLLDEHIVPHLNDGEAFVEGHHDHLSRKLNLTTLEVEDHVPPQPSADHEWIDETKRWTLTPAAQDRQAKAQAALGRITSLERDQARPLRELLLDPSNAEARKRLASVEAQIVEARKDLVSMTQDSAL